MKASWIWWLYSISFPVQFCKLRIPHILLCTIVCLIWYAFSIWACFNSLSSVKPVTSFPLELLHQDIPLRFGNMIGVSEATSNDLHKTNAMNCSASPSKWPGLCGLNERFLAFSNYWLLKFSVMDTYLNVYSCVNKCWSKTEEFLIVYIFCIAFLSFLFFFFFLIIVSRGQIS